MLFNRENNSPRTSSPYQLLYLMSEFDYVDFDTLMSPQDVMNTLSGSCHDQVMFEMDELTKQGLNPKAKFIMSVDSDNVGGETHSFVIYQEGSKYYWFENAWEDYAGIHEFNSESELIDFVIDAFMNRNPNQYLFISDFIPEEHTVGESLDDLVDICMVDAVQV